MLEITGPFHRKWDTNQTFRQVIESCRGVTVIDPIRLLILYELALYAGVLGGPAAEVGVYRGGSAKVIAQAIQDEDIHLFDTFRGIPHADLQRGDQHKVGDFGDVIFEEVQVFLKPFPKVHFHRGLFEERSLDEFPAEVRFAFVHIDVDVYQSVKACCEAFHPRMKPGGIMLFDDYGSMGCDGVRQAVDEYFGELGSITLPTAQCFVVRLP